MIDIILPVWNEEAVLEKNTLILYNYLTKNFKEQWQIIIADNGSTDRTLYIAKELTKRYPKIEYIGVGKKGRGRALRKALMNSKADILAYMDIDLSTDLKHLCELTNAIKKGAYVATGSRLLKKSKIKRSLVREILSKGYNLLAKLIIGTKISDLQCGFKAFNVKKVKKILPEIKDNNWFFDTESLIVAERKGYKIKEIPVRWIEGKNSSVKILETIIYYIKSLNRLNKK